MRQNIIDFIVFLLIGIVAGLVLASLVAVVTIPHRLSEIEKSINQTERTLQAFSDSIYW